MSEYDVVLHVDKPDNSLAIAFTNAVNYAKALPGEHFSMVLVVNSAAVTLLKRGNKEIAGALEEAVASGLSVRVCNNALESTRTDPEEMYPQCVVIPPGLVEIVRLQRKGYAYIKP